VLVLCRPYLGDLVLTGPVFRNLRGWRPGARIVAGAYPESAEMLSFFPEIDDFLPIPRRPRRGPLSLVAEWAGTLRRARAERFDLVYDLMHTDRSALVTLATGAPRRLGFIKDRRRLRYRVYTDLVSWAGELERTHTSELYLKALAEIGMPIATRSIALPVTAEDAAAADARLARALGGGSGPLLVVHPGAGTPNRLWPAERYAEVCDRVQDALGGRVLLLGGPREAPLLAAIRAAMQTPAAALLEGPLSLRQMAAILQRADLFLGSDAGPAHLAAAVGTRAVVLFGAALPAQWAPLGEGHTVLRPSMPCGACVAPELCRPLDPYHMFCVRRISAAEVGDAVERSLAPGRGQAAHA
jgi:ADP-heptose:LPS heptosyltransferase